MFNKNFIILCIGQTFSYTSPVVNILLSGIIGSRLINFAILSTLPTALMVVGTAIGSLFAFLFIGIFLVYLPSVIKTGGTSLQTDMVAGGAAGTSGIKAIGS